MIRTWRDRLPQAAGLPTATGRRAAGLRREELAELAGVSVDYIVRLEQGAPPRPRWAWWHPWRAPCNSPRTSGTDLYRLAQLVPPDHGAVRDHLPPGVQRVLARLGDVAVAVFAADWQLIWWNRGWAALLGDPATSPAGLRNFARDRFPVDGSPARLALWPVTETDRDATDARRRPPTCAAPPAASPTTSASPVWSAN
ncbi:hypothetical protein SALBM135S_02953 [Streptomyces alboniger]